MYYDNYKLHQLIAGLSDDRIQWFMIQAQHFICKRYPHAVLMYSSDQRGKTAHVGIYDIRLVLNPRHTFKAALQYAPQKLIGPIPFSDDWEPTYKVRYLQNLWATLAISIMSKEVEQMRKNGVSEV